MGVVTGWTGHTPTPSDGPSRVSGAGVAIVKCKFCTMYVRPVWRLTGRQKMQTWMHVRDENVTSHHNFDVNSAKDLYESLDAMWLAIDDNTKADMMTALGTICGWSHNPEMWNTIKRWIDSKEDL